MDSTRCSRRIAGAAIATLLGQAFAARAADYPTRPIELVVPSSAGGGTDIVARAFAGAARGHSPQPFIVINRPGASGAIGMGEVLNARLDGYKVSVVIVELAILPLLGQIRFTTDDFRMIARLNADPAAIVVPSGARWSTIEEFVADARSRAGQITLGNAGVGSIWHLAAAALEEKTGAQFLHVPYQGSAPGLLALVGGHVAAIAVSPGEATAHVSGGRAKVLAVMADRRVAGFEDVPTLKERGIDLSIGNWRGIAVPKATPQPVVDFLADITRKVALDAGFQDALSRSNLGYAYLETGDFEAAIRQEREFFVHLARNLQLQ